MLLDVYTRHNKKVAASQTLGKSKGLHQQACPDMDRHARHAQGTAMHAQQGRIMARASDDARP